jgi:membrane-bound lytic murein transglycosylase B
MRFFYENAMNPRMQPAPTGDSPRPARRGRGCIRFSGLLFFLLVAQVRPAAADWNPLVERLTADGFDRQVLETLFTRPEVRFEPDAMAGKLKSLIQSRSPLPDSLAARMKDAVYRTYLTSGMVARARSYTEENMAVLKEIDARYGVPKEIVVSILLVETHLGEKTGSQLVFNRLASMALYTDLEAIRPYLSSSLITPDNWEYARRRCREKANWAYSELKALLHLADRYSLDPTTIRGSIYGAIGLCQFMPSSVFFYGVDADQDGRIDLFAKPDALYSIANYLRQHGWRKKMDRKSQRSIILTYNHSTIYANTVLAVADKLRNRK